MVQRDPISCHPRFSLSRHVGAAAGAEAVSVLAFSVSVTEREQIFHLSWFCISGALSPSHSSALPPFCFALFPLASFPFFCLFQY